MQDNCCTHANQNKDPEINQSIERLYNNTSVIGTKLSILRERLERVLIPLPVPVTACGEMPSAPIVVPLAFELSKIADDYSTLRDILDDILERLDL